MNSYKVGKQTPLPLGQNQPAKWESTRMFLNPVKHVVTRRHQNLLIYDFPFQAANYSSAQVVCFLETNTQFAS